MKKISLIILLMTFMGLGAAAFYFSEEQVVAPESTGYQLITKPCWFDLDWRKKVKCFHLKTAQEQGVFFLPVVIIVDESDDHRPDPVLYLQGGPGAGAGLHQESMERWLNWVGLADVKRDVILMDQRGTGESLPKLNCNDKGEQIRSWKRNDSLKDELQANNQAMLACFDQLQTADAAINPQHFSTAISAQDILQLMQQLDYAEWNLLGVSYGTRLALELERQDQTKKTGLKAMVLDSVYPAGAGGVQTWPDVLDDALKQFFNACLSQIECATYFAEDDIESAFIASLQKLKQLPVRLTIKRWDGEAPVEFILNDHRFVSVVFAATYDPQAWHKIASAVHAINHQSSYEIEVQLKQLVEPYLNRNMDQDFNALAFTAVDCADNPLGSEADYQQAVERNSMLAEYTRDQWQYQLCHDLKNNNSLQRVKTQLPMLLLSGRHDPVTPVSWAEEIQNNSLKGQLIIREDLAHSVLSTDVCVLQNLYKFFDDPQKEFNYCQ